MAPDTISPEAIREAREQAGLTQTEAADRSGLTRATIQNAETGRRSPAGYVLASLARVYGCSMDAFVVHEQDATEPPSGRKQAEKTPAPRPLPSGTNRVDGMKAGAR